MKSIGRIVEFTPDARAARRALGRISAILLATAFLLSVVSAQATQPRPVGPTDSSAQALATEVPQVLLLISNVNTLFPENPTVWGTTAQFLLTDNDTEAHEIVFSAHVNQSVDWTTSASNSSGSYFAAPNILTDQTVAAASTIQFVIHFPTTGTYQFIDRAYFNLPPYNSSGNVTVNAIPTSPTPSSDTDDTTINAGYLVGGLAIGLIVGVAAMALVARRRK